jgi:4-hydroxy-tetrahydrodipicolinate reductase
MTIRIALAGAAGRMGRALALAADGEFILAGGSEREGSPELGSEIAPGVVVTANLAKAAETADVWIDFTRPDATIAALDALRETPVRAAIIGTTGFSPTQEAQIAAHARRIAIVKAGNFSLGVNLLLSLVEQAAQRLGHDWDIEIFETHHRHKVDAPSGTALMLGEAAAHGRGAALPEVRTPPYDGQTGPRRAGAIGFSVSRGGGVIGDHEARFISAEEMVVLGHRALDRAIFARGALHAARWAVKRPPALYTMRDVLSL